MIKKKNQNQHVILRLLHLTPREKKLRLFKISIFSQLKVQKCFWKED
jgi:hypothetical protein